MIEISGLPSDSANPPLKQTVLVCVTCQKQSRDTIRMGCALAQKLNAAVRVVCAVPNDRTIDTQLLDELFQLCTDADATITVAFSAQAVPTIVRVAKKQGVEHIVMGHPSDSGPDSILAKVARLLPDAQLYWSNEGRLRTAPRTPSLMRIS